MTDQSLLPIPFVPRKKTPPKTGADNAMQKISTINPRATLGHIFMITVETALLLVQFFRMETLAFDVLPELADIDLGFMYGSHLMGLIWLLVVVLVSYTSWECAIRLHGQEAKSSVTLKLATICLWMINAGAMVFEFVLFRMLVDDFGSQGFAGAAELFGLLMVATHQIASFWIMKNVVRKLFLDDEDTTERKAQ